MASDSLLEQEPTFSRVRSTDPEKVKAKKLSIGRERSLTFTSVKRVTSSISLKIKRNRHIVAKLDLYFTAALSISDMLCDIVMIFRYFSRGQGGFALASIICVGLNLAVQSYLVFVQHRQKNDWLLMAKEQTIVFSLLKPGVDAHRVATSMKQGVGEVTDSQTEMTYMKIVELVTESIPGTIIQLFAMFSARGDASVMPVLSLASSIATSAFIATQIGYEWDADQHKRKIMPSLYGYLNLKSLRRLFWQLSWLFLLSVFTLMMRAFTCVMLFERGGSKLLVAVLFGELVGFLLIKTARGDIDYWADISFPSVLTQRSFLFFCCSWTACPQFRHPLELGGAMWSLIIMWTVALAATLGLTQQDEAVRTLAAAVCTGTCVSYVIFLASMESKYRNTFLRALTGKGFLRDEYRNAGTDEAKMFVVSYKESYWRPEVGDEVKEWLQSKLPGWLEEQPEWFDQLRRSQIPDWAIEHPEVLLRL
eukprot:CAMPEP_0182456812 /NCGR_PEP_ID=MMETSP1319-20130603/2546_1 /TAXON_ID=172717 /ORGANISM="Bolidomonas pacifica, Strain RCC208" /LENGTH=477 /DNA_ID=CAMNT_0024655133 /DNA_START=284 /DNA_END=1714 /DNA_ORIENTATION=+